LSQISSLFSWYQPLFHFLHRISAELKIILPCKTESDKAVKSAQKNSNNCKVNGAKKYGF
jgi:hypothetical protein